MTNDQYREMGGSHDGWDPAGQAQFGDSLYRGRAPAIKRIGGHDGKRILLQNFRKPVFRDWRLEANAVPAPYPHDRR